MSPFPFSDAVKGNRVRLRSHGRTRYITFPAFDPHPEVFALMTLRTKEPSSPTASREVIAAAAPFLTDVLGIPLHNIVAGIQVHGRNVFSLAKSTPEASRTSEPRIIPSTDGFLTNARRFALTVVTADCLPIFLYDPQRSIIGLFHCGRAGTSEDILGAGMQRMMDDFGSEPEDCIAVIGPSVGPYCYDIDLWAANEYRLKDLGVSKVFNCRVCTRCNNDLFYSYRAERERAGRMISAIALKR